MWQNRNGGDDFEITALKIYRYSCGWVHYSTLHLSCQQQQLWSVQWNTSLSKSRNPPPFTKPGVSLPCSQEPATGLCPESVISSPHHHIIFL